MKNCNPKKDCENAENQQECEAAEKQRRKESHTLVRDNFDVNLWIDGGVYDGCAAFQKILDGMLNSQLPCLCQVNFLKYFSVIYAWGVQYDRGCNGKWDDTKKNSWFKRYWRNAFRKITDSVKTKLGQGNGQGVFEQCHFSAGF